MTGAMPYSSGEVSGIVSILVGGFGFLSNLDRLRPVSVLFRDDKPRFNDRIEFIVMMLRLLPDRESMIGLFLSNGKTSSSICGFSAGGIRPAGGLSGT